MRSLRVIATIPACGGSGSTRGCECAALRRERFVGLAPARRVGRGRVRGWVLASGERGASRYATGGFDHLEAIALLMLVIIVAQPSAGVSMPDTMLASVWPQKFQTEPIAGIAGARAPDSATFAKSLMS